MRQCLYQSTFVRYIYDRSRFLCSLYYSFYSQNRIKTITDTWIIVCNFFKKLIHDSGLTKILWFSRPWQWWRRIPTAQRLALMSSAQGKGIVYFPILKFVTIKFTPHVPYVSVERKLRKPESLSNAKNSSIRSFTTKVVDDVW